MASKKVRMQFRVVIFTRPNDSTDVASTPTRYDAAQDTLLFAAGSFNNPPNPGEQVFTSEMAACQQGYSTVKKLQVGLGQNARLSVFGKPCGTADGNAARQLNGAGATTDETAERCYIMADAISPGLSDAIRFANRVPDTASLTIRTEVGPEVPVVASASSDLAPADPGG